MATAGTILFELLSTGLLLSEPIEELAEPNRTWAVQSEGHTSGREMTKALEDAFKSDAHGLETDVVTQGDSPEHALAMMADALQALASHQALRRRPTLQLRPAPAEIWDLAADAVPLDLTAHVDRRRRGAASPSAGPWGLYGLLSRKPPASRAR